MEALNKLDETLIGNLELKILLSRAIKKQMPMQVKATDVKVRDCCQRVIALAKDFRCPICNNSLAYVFSKQKYCSNCGQALDWRSKQ